MAKQSVYQRAVTKGCTFVGACVSLNEREINRMMKGARKADRKKVLRVALFAQVIDSEQYKKEMQNDWYNPYSHFVSSSYVIYVHSAIEHFIKVNE